MIFERAARAGSFFDEYPRHRRLISLNKRFTGRSSPEFNLRHDWNSLLETNVLPMTNRSVERFPHADVLADYLRDFAKAQEEAGRVQYDTNVEAIDRRCEVDKGYVLIIRRADGSIPDEIGCNAVIHAGGNHIPNMPESWGRKGFDATRCPPRAQPYNLALLQPF